MQIVNSLFNELEDARSTWTEIYSLLKQAQYDTSAPRPAIEQASVDGLNRRILIMFDILLGMRPQSEDDVNSLILFVRASEIQNLINNFKSHSQSTLDQMRSNWQDNITIRETNNNFNWQFFIEETNTANINVSSNFSNINSSINQLMAQIGFLLPFCKADGISDLTIRSQALAEVGREMESFRNDARKYAKSGKESAINASDSEKEAQNFMTRAEAVFSKIQALQQETEREASNINNLIAQIKNVGASAGTLEQQIIGYQSKFDAFQSQLDSRLKMFLEFETKTKQAEKENQQRESEIDRLISKADTMIRGATTAGLSKSLEDTRDLYSKRMYWARIGFFFSIAFISISAFPLVGHLLPGLFGNWGPAVSEQTLNSKFGVIGKIFLLLPATWLTVFFTKSFAEFFHLEREYAHKAALAKSVEGFKREAPKYEEEITTSVFGEILNNPSKGKFPEPANHPLYEVLTKRLSEMFGKK